MAYPQPRTWSDSDDDDIRPKDHIDLTSDSDEERSEASDTPQDEISKALGEFISSNSSTFTCGGIIPIYDTHTSRREALKTASSNVCLAAPVTIRWDSAKGPGTPVQFPIQDQTHAAALDGLVETCSPAGFGRGDQDVMDPEYRTAIKMDTSEFSTNLCPYALGIMDQVTRMLLPNMIDHNREGVAPRSIVVAELYKLNVCIWSNCVSLASN